MTTRYFFKFGYQVVHVRKPDGHHITVRSGPVEQTGTYKSLACLELALDTLSLVTGAPWERCTQEG